MQNRLYKIRYTGLPEGIHEYEYHLEQDFFRMNEDSSIENADLNVKISIKKDSDRLMELNFEINGTVQLQCDRCLEYYNQNIAVQESLIVKLGKTYLEEAENIIVWPENNPYIDLAPHIYDYIVLCLPYQRIHPLDASGNSTCDMNMINKLNEYLVGETSEEVDPRWNKLKNLLN